MVENKKWATVLSEINERQDYFVSQANDLAKSFGNLSLKEQQVLDFCFSYVKPDDGQKSVYHTSASEVIKHLGVSKTGPNYKLVAKSFDNLLYKTPLAVKEVYEDGSWAINKFHLFERVRSHSSDDIEFKFSEDAEPYVFDLVSHFYSFRLWELSRVKSKYGLILLKLWQSKRMGNSVKTTILGPNEDWYQWFLGDEDDRPSYTPGQFKQNCLERGIASLQKAFPNCSFDLQVKKHGRETVGYILDIIDNGQARNRSDIVVPTNVTF